MWVAFPMSLETPASARALPSFRPQNMPPLNGMESAASALRYWERKQDITANNLANVSSDGFKAQRVFARLMDGVRPVAEATSDLTTGSIRQTGSPLDVAIDGPGFFVVATPNGERYTRGGSLRLDDKHHLVDTDGRPLLDVKKNAPITLASGQIDIDSAGQVKQGGAIVGQLRMELAPKGAELTREGQALWVPPATRQVVDPAARNVKQGYIEDSNVNSMSALIDMVSVQRSFASVQKAVIELDKTNETITTQIAKAF